MKYTLLKKWHPSQVEEVGHVFEKDKVNSEYVIDNIVYRIPMGLNVNHRVFVYPHEIALLVDAGYLKKQEEFPELKCTGNKTCLFGCRNCQKPEQKIDLWTEMPPKHTTYWCVTDYGLVMYYQWDSTKHDLFHLKTNNCHKTQESAEEALKRLLE